MSTCPGIASEGGSIGFPFGQYGVGVEQMGSKVSGVKGKAALAVTRRSLPGRMNADPVAALGPGLHVAIVGSGSPIPDRQRGNPCVAVIAGEKVWIVDAGEGASETLGRMQVDPGGIEGVLLTHFHSDHIGGLGSVALQRWVAGRTPATQPMPVIGPEGVEKVIDGLNAAYAQDASYRTAHHGEAIAPAGGAGMEARPYKQPEGEEELVVLEEDGLKVTAFRVDHAPVDPAVGYRFDYQGRSAVISGDTSYVPVMEQVSRGADLLVHDALSRELLGLVQNAAGAAGRNTRRQIMIDIVDYHASPQEAAEVAGKAGVGGLVLTHIVPPLPLRGLEGPFLEGCEARYSGPIWIARDGDLFSLPAGGKEIRRSSLIPRRPGA